MVYIFVQFDPIRIYHIYLLDYYDKSVHSLPSYFNTCSHFNEVLGFNNQRYNDQSMSQPNSSTFKTNYHLIQYLKERNIIKSELVYYTMMSMDRKNFIPSPPYYVDQSSPIGHGAIISAPHMHAYALDYLISALQAATNVLDVGSGSGYMVMAMALLTPKSAKIYGIQHSKQLVQQSIISLRKQNEDILTKINIVTGDGRKGWINSQINFDVIHVGAACTTIPLPLVDQLSQKGVMIVPIGEERSVQQYTKIEKKNGKIEQTVLQYVCYVPLTDLDYQKIR